MKKCLLLVAALLLQLCQISAQSLFNVPDTVCVRQPIQLTSNVTASSYYWGFCSGYLFYDPVGTNLGVMPGANGPSAIDVIKEGKNYYGFVANSVSSELLKLEFGTSLANAPVITNLGTLNNTMPLEPSKIFTTKDANGDWFMFITGGSTALNSSFARLDFGKSLGNTPNAVNFGNLAGVLNAPKGIFVIQQGANYTGYVANSADNRLIKLDFSSNISFTPNMTDLGAIFGLDGVSDMVPVKNDTDWYVFATNLGNNTLSRLDFGTDITSVPQATNFGNPGNWLVGPTSITFARDCGSIHLFVTNNVSNNIVRIDMTDITGPYTADPYLPVGGMSVPTSMSRIVREGDNLYTFVTNLFTNELTKVTYAGCTTASITSATTSIPPVYSYSVPSTYNVRFVIDEGLPTMQVECQEIVALPLPQMTVSNDTIICQGDTIDLFIQAFGSLSQTWSPNYNIDDVNGFAIKVWPDYTTEYHVVLPYANGCIVDEPVNVAVWKNKADAGPDRKLFDGASTILGGPMTTYTDTPGKYTYNWFPSDFLSATNITNPVANPSNDLTYYLEVRDNHGCYDIDTVVVHVECNNLNLPNAFAPGSRNEGSKDFGILNNQIVKLNYFRVFDRWGKEVFTTTDPAKHWDGTVNGDPAPMGVYVWEADGFCLEGQRFKRSGNVTLLR